MTDDAVGEVLGGVSIILLCPVAVFEALNGRFQTATYCMAWAAFLVALSNHEA